MGMLDELSNKFKTTTCFCWSLETCVKVQGYLSVVFSLLSIALFGAFIADLKANSYGPNVYFLTGLHDRLVLEIAFSCTLVYLMISVVFTVMLLRGVHMKNKCHIMPYMISSALRVIGWTLSVNLILMLSEEKTWAILPAIMGPLEMFCWLHVYSLFKKLGESQSPLDQPTIFCSTQPSQA